MYIRPDERSRLLVRSQYLGVSLRESYRSLAVVSVGFVDNNVTFSREFERNFPLVYTRLRWHSVLPTSSSPSSNHEVAPFFFLSSLLSKLPFTFLPMGSLTFAKLPSAAFGALLEFRLTIRLFAAYGILHAFRSLVRLPASSSETSASTSYNTSGDQRCT